MTIDEKTAITQEISYELGIEAITVKYEKGTRYFANPVGLSILDRFPSGQFNNRECDMRPFAGSENAGEEEDFKISEIHYGRLGKRWYHESGGSSIGLNFEEYVQLGRPRIIRLDQRLVISSNDE